MGEREKIRNSPNLWEKPRLFLRNGRGIVNLLSNITDLVYFHPRLHPRKRRLLLLRYLLSLIHLYYFWLYSFPFLLLLQLLPKHLFLILELQESSFSSS